MKTFLNCYKKNLYQKYLSYKESYKINIVICKYLVYVIPHLLWGIFNLILMLF